MNMIRIGLRLPKTPGSHPVSRLFRPIFEARRAKAAFGGLLSAASFILAVVIYPVLSGSPVQALGQVEANEIVIETTSSGPAKLLPNMKRTSQGYSALHPGVDITAELGSEIYPVKAGRVASVSISRYDYGRSVIVDHGDGLTSLYAHMGKIMVDEGEEVTDRTVIGEVGLTGRTTGPHLHLEIRKNGVPSNPLRFLREVLAHK